VRTAEWASLAKDDLELLFQWLASQERIERLTAGHQIFVGIRATICLRKEMLDARIGLRQRALAKEAVTTLLKK
jgi:hypothetical protein